jgi:threonine/homoserine/homoserine lactone efflux protein
MNTNLWLIFSFSFVVALSGALVPGPLLTYTILKTMQTRRRSFLTGAWVIGGHALLESLLITAILLGFSVVLQAPLTIKIIATVGGLFLLYMGLGLVLDVLRNRVPDIFGTESPETAGNGNPKISSPVLGGLLISMSNPYWWIWWATVGFAFMTQYRLSFFNWPALLAFVIGHELGDLSWYFTVSTLVSLGRQRINLKLYRLLLILCGVFLAAFGFYLGLKAYL